MIMSERIRIAIAGVGNCASVLIQGLQYYGKDDTLPGLWHRVVGGFRVSDIEIVEAFDIDSNKVGLDLTEAIFMPPNNVAKYVNLKSFGVKVREGILLDRLSPYLKQAINLSNNEVSIEDIAKILIEGKVDIFVNLISSGMDKSSYAYAKAALQAKCSFINCTPSPIISNEELVKGFEDSKLVLIGDDLMSQFGGTVFHKGILSFMHKRGVKVLKSYQLDVGGGLETLNTIDEEIKANKRILKTNAIISEIPYEFESVAGTTDYVDYLGNNRVSYFWIEGEGFLGSPIKIDIYLKTRDGPNAGNILLDVIRAVQFARRNGYYGLVNEICNYGFKRSPKIMNLDESYQRFKEIYLR